MIARSQAEEIMRCVRGATIALLLASSACTSSDQIPSSRTHGAAGSSEVLHSLLVDAGVPFDRALPMAAFRAPPGATAPQPAVDGRWRLVGPVVAEGFIVHRDQFGLASEQRLATATLPELDIELVQDGRSLVPVERGSIRAEHPSWEWVVEPGLVWNEASQGGWRRAVLPIALHERNANCVHNGVLALRFRAGDPQSRAAWQIASETCAYFQFDTWGRADVEYRPTTIALADAVRQAHRREVARRLPIRPLAQLQVAHPAVDPGGFGDASEVLPEAMTTFGVVVDGVHYRGGCGTRQGPYPFCEQLVLPSYSLAKSIFGGLALAGLEARYPGSATRPIADLVPECDFAGGWQDVTLADALDMATGRFDSAAPLADEEAAVTSELFLAEDHATRVRYACTRYDRRSAPGRRFVYHTSDTYLAGAAMSELLRRHAGPQADLYRDVLAAGLWQPLGLSPLLRETRRTRDEVAQPFTGWGLLLLPDDVARLAQWLASGDGRIDGRPVLDEARLAQALHRSPRQPGLVAGEGTLRYRGGFWGLDIAEWIGCPHAVWVPFMSGYGGLTVAMFPNEIVYYYFSDGGAWRWREAAIAAHRIRSMCPGPA